MQLDTGLLSTNNLGQQSATSRDFYLPAEQRVKAVKHCSLSAAGGLRGLGRWWGMGG